MIPKPRPPRRPNLGGPGIPSRAPRPTTHKNSTASTRGSKVDNVGSTAPRFSRKLSHPHPEPKSYSGKG